MEIIHLILGKANPNRMNGVNKVVFQLTTWQKKAQKEVSIWGITNDLTHNYGDRNFKTRLFPSEKNPFKIHDALRNAILEKKGTAIFHLHGGWIPIYSSISKLMDQHHIKFILTPHGAYNKIAMERSKWIKKLYFQLFEKSLIHRASCIHCIGQSEQDGLTHLYPNKKTVLLPYGINLKNEKLYSKSQSKEFIIGFMGRLDVYTKGLDLLFASFREFHKLEPHSKLWIIGDGSEKVVLEFLAQEYHIQDEVIFWGSKYGKEKNELLKKMDVFAHPSRNEGLPSSILEASNLGVPSVVSYATNLAEYIVKSDAGIVIANESETALTHAFYILKKLKSKNELFKLGQNAKQMVHTFFNWNHIVKQYDLLYE
jgi:glycosyltransferase involved in cell wall biosynthesis